MTVCSMSRDWDAPVPGGFPARDLVTGLLLPTASEVADAFSSALPSGLRPASCNSRSPPRTFACKKNLGSSCVRLPAIAGAHTDMCNTKVKAFRSICHGSLLDVFCCGSAIRACDTGGKCQPALRLLVGMRHNDWLPQVFQLQFSNQRVREGWTMAACIWTACRDTTP